ncbi:hypothetical protein JMJ35_004460 [Cladonia borealis]|uniref:Uncharacterized protein n=1 Tax=Cladonia borealis TaxID=184061 RepID=A0AA39R443_9LECA|nr:hypothetical protein JMJ35_004460 [Cladonia borealis]
MATPYPSAYQIEEMFANRDVPDIFHTYLADPIDVVVVGQDFHVGGQYKSREAFHQGIYAHPREIAQIKEFLDSGHLQHHVEHHESKQGKKVEIPGHIPTVKGTSNAS